MLAPDVEQERSLLGGQLARASAVGARVGLEALETLPLVRVVPTLDRRRAIALRSAPAWRAIAHLGQLGNLGSELAARQLATNQRADELSAKQGNLLRVVTRSEQVFGHGISF